MTTDSNLDAYFTEIDARLVDLAARAAKEEDEREKRKRDLLDMAAAEIRDFLSTAGPPAAALLTRSIRVKSERGNSQSVSIEATIETDGIAPITIAARAGANPLNAWITEMSTAGQSWSHCTPDNFRSVLIAARAEWLQRHAEKRQAEQRTAENRAALSAALVAWEPDYRAYLIALDAAYTHNAGILRGIARDMTEKPFEVRRLTYGIVYGEGADPATEDAWIISRSTRNETEEIGNDGVIFDTRYYHPVSVTAPQTWTPARCKEESPFTTGKRPPIREHRARSGWVEVKIIAPPSRRPLDEEMKEAVANAGGLLDWPHPPTPPTAPTPELEELILRRAAELAAEHLSEACSAEVGEQAIRTAISDFDF